ESKLQAKEKELQRQLKSAEVEVSQRLSRRAVTALWKPLINGLARLRFSKEEIEAFAASGQTFQLLRQTVSSWQGLLALFLTGIFIAITVSPDGWSQTLALLQQWLQSSGLANLIASLMPDWLKAIPTEAMVVFEWMRANLPIGLQIFTGTLVALVPTVKALGEYVASVQKEQARIQSERDSLLQQEQGKAEGLAKEVAQLKLQVEEQRQRLGLTANYSSLLDFVNSRLAGDDYGKHLGLMQQVKQDLAALSDRLTEGAHNQEELKKIFPRGPARVILYIDDLDRCPPNRVVEVLEAVQLLLNTKLFIVVLGIDDRYIARALEEVYRGVLKRRGKPSGIDYLEKIIQIPYRMRPISPATVESYLRAQLQIRKPSEQQAAPANPADTQSTAQPQTPARPLDLPQSPQAVEEQPKPTDELANTPPVESSEPHDVAAPIAAPLSVEQTLEQTDSPTSLSDSPTSSSPTSNFPTPSISNIQQTIENSHDNGQLPSNLEGANVHPSGFMPFRQSDSYSENIAQVTEFDEVEFKILVDCCKQVDITPRTAKRLINIYKILQIIWATRSQQSPSQPPPSEQDKRLVMSFLALSGRYPTFMRNLFEEIDVLLEEKSLDESQDGNPDNPQIAIALKDMLDKINPQLLGTDFHAQREWRRFSSDIQRMLHNPTLKFDRQTFELMLSFCFVGDIGYDPDDYSPNSQPHSYPGQQHPDHNPA
ncbi:MAG TPA: P-loop NTPase fold protein, partial [Chroococcidiopsis sp.]